MSILSKGSRRLAAIMFTDMVGFSRRTEENEALTLELLEEHRGILRPVIAGYGGRVIKTTGDGFHVEFSSVLDSVRCAVEMQKALYLRNAGVAEPRRVQIRIGVHLGDVTELDGDIFGEGVNLAARIEPLAEPGGICVSRPVCDLVRNQLKERLFRVGVERLKNLKEPVEVFGVALPWVAHADGGAPPPAAVPAVTSIMVLFIAGFDEIFHRQEAAAARLLTAHYRIVREHLEEHGGREIKKHGGLVLIEFPESTAAIRAAIGMQHAHDELARRDPLVGPGSRLRVGVHEGPVIRLADDVLGDTINLAARIAGAAPPGSIWMSGGTCRSVAGRLTQPVTECAPLSVRGLTEPVAIFSVDSCREQAAPAAAGSHAGPEHELLAVMTTDLRGFTALIRQDEGEGLKFLGEYYRCIRQAVAAHRGRELNLLGDMFFVGFLSVTDACRCALTAERAITSWGRMRVGFGIHFGDVAKVDGEALGEPLVWAEALSGSSMEGIVGQEGAIFVSGQVADMIRRQPEFALAPVDVAGKDWLPAGLAVVHLTAGVGAA